jgi:hypothetical protein
MKPVKLAILNAHPRDENIEFDEGPHIYSVNGDSNYTSVTTLNHSYFEEFDADGIITNILRSKKINDPTYRYFGMTRADIKKQWTDTGKLASGSGTQMHADIEYYYNDLPVNNNSLEYEYFLRFKSDFPELKPYRTEWVIYHEELRIAGSVDMVYENPDGTLQIYDWKRVKEIKYDHDTNFGNEKYSKVECIKHIPDTNYWHYALQLNTYKRIIEEKYGKIVTDLYLVCLYPENPLKSYERIKICDLSKEIAELFQRRKELVDKNKK